MLEVWLLILSVVPMAPLTLEGQLKNTDPGPICPSHGATPPVPWALAAQITIVTPQNPPISRPSWEDLRDPADETTAHLPHGPALVLMFSFGR